MTIVQVSFPRNERPFGREVGWILYSRVPAFLNAERLDQNRQLHETELNNLDFLTIYSYVFMPNGIAEFLFFLIL